MLCRPVPRQCCPSSDFLESTIWRTPGLPDGARRLRADRAGGRRRRRAGAGAGRTIRARPPETTRQATSRRLLRRADARPRRQPPRRIVRSTRDDGAPERDSVGHGLERRRRQLRRERAEHGRRQLHDSALDASLRRADDASADAADAVAVGDHVPLALVARRADEPRAHGVARADVFARADDGGAVAAAVGRADEAAAARADARAHVRADDGGARAAADAAADARRPVAVAVVRADAAADEAADAQAVARTLVQAVQGADLLPDDLRVRLGAADLRADDARAVPRAVAAARAEPHLLFARADASADGTGADEQHADDAAAAAADAAAVRRTVLLHTPHGHVGSDADAVARADAAAVVRRPHGGTDVPARAAADRRAHGPADVALAELRADGRVADGRADAAHTGADGPRRSELRADVLPVGGSVVHARVEADGAAVGRRHEAAVRPGRHLRPDARERGVARRVQQQRRLEQRRDQAADRGGRAR